MFIILHKEKCLHLTKRKHSTKLKNDFGVLQFMQDYEKWQKYNLSNLIYPSVKVIVGGRTRTFGNF